METSLRSELQSAQKMIVSGMHHVESTEHAAREEERRVRQAVEDYNRKRMDLFGELLREKGLVYCTWGGCRKSTGFTREKRPRFIYTEGCRLHSCGYQDSCYTYRDYAELHHVCQRCAQKMLLRSGMRDTYDHVAENQQSFDAFVARKRKDGFYTRKSGVWQKLSEDVCTLKEPPEQWVDEFVEGHDFPPRITFTRDLWGGFGKLTVHSSGNTTGR